MQERGTGTIQGLEKLPPRKRQEWLWVFGEMLKVQLDLHTSKEFLESGQISVLQTLHGEMQKKHTLKQGKR